VSIQADISKMEDIDRIYKKIAGDGKALDVLFANAGGGSFAPLGSVGVGNCSRSTETRAFLEQVRIGLL